MKMVKSLLLGSAAGLVAVAGAQAAELPVKAAPVEYVKICSLYGDGFFYIPGTDTCLKIGGYVRWELDTPNAGGSHSPNISGGSGFADRSINDNVYQMRTRFAISADARTQTDYGTLRAYIRMGAEETTNATDGGAGTFYIERGFIQFAGFTAGKTQSYFDFFQGVFSYGSTFWGGGSDTLGQAINLFAYTTQLGNGISFTLSAEDNTYRRNAIWDATDKINALNIGSWPGPDGTVYFGGNTCGVGGVNIATGDDGATRLFGCTTGDYAGTQAPDIVASLRVDQAWGTAQVAGALHQLRANFYGNDSIPSNPTYTGIAPADRWGWAAMAGIVINLPWSTCCGDKLYDKFWIEGAYSEGAPSYNGFANSGLDPVYDRFSGRNVAAGWALDAIFANNPVTPFSGLVLPTTWDVAAAIEHYWTPSLRTSVFSSYTLWDPGADGNTIMCSSPSSPVRTNTPLPEAPNGRAALSGCDFKFAVWGVGTRTIWNPVKNLELGLEVMYSKIDQFMDPNQILFNFGGSRDRAQGFYSPASEDVWSGTVRAVRYFYP
jgi:hypothetical protein